MALAPPSRPAGPTPFPDPELLSLPGIGPVRAAALAEAGIRSRDELLCLAPRRYEDRSSFLSLAGLAALPAGTRATVLVEVVNCRFVRTRRRGFTMTRAAVRDATSTQEVVWFNQPYLARHLEAGRQVILYGALRPTRSGKGPDQMDNPEIELVPREQGPEGSIHMGRIVPVYIRTAGLSCRQLRRLLHEVVARGIPEGDDPLPLALRQEHGLPQRSQALAALHFPEAGSNLDDLAQWRTPAQRRLIFEELVLLFVALQMKRSQRGLEPRGWKCEWTEDLDRRMRSWMPFHLTPGQEKAWQCIQGDLRGPSPMARLLQGDVGSGKTAVALMAMLLAVENGCQAVLMAPTEILASQHHAQIQRLMGEHAPPLHLLAGGQRNAAGRKRREALAAGQPGLVVGTHALIQKDVEFGRLGLVVIDEQHRFGVAQRLSLTAKGHQPDLLVMTATPIPRSLALTRYGDLDLVEIRDRPPGRIPVTTCVMNRRRRGQVWEEVHSRVLRGEQAYIVYPLVVESEQGDLAAASQAYEGLRAGPLADVPVGLVHGRLPAGEKQEVMNAFAAGDVRVLVATTVIEVGVDVPMATLLVVDHANRFGLAQLHQLRGRVGRGKIPSKCIFLHDSELSSEAQARLKILQESDDGFHLAMEDLRLRGPGELLGLRQHGAVGLRLADVVRDEGILEMARGATEEMAAAGIEDTLADAARRRWARLLEPVDG